MGVVLAFLPGGGAVLKKIPIIGLLIGAVAAIIIKMKRKGPESEAPAEDTNPPA